MPLTIQTFTYGTAIQEICRLVGHPIPTDAAGSTDQAVLQMGSAVNFAMKELLTMHEWEELTIKTTLAIVADSPGQKEKGFALPADFYRFVDQSQWSSGSLWPAGGPVDNQSWMAYQVQNYSPQMTLFWQLREGLLRVLNPPFPVSVNLEYMYLSSAQVIDQDDPATLKNFANKNGDIFKLDSFVIMLLGRARYLEWKGFDASAAVRDFLSIFNSRAGDDKGAPILSLSRGIGAPLINPITSLPQTGYGN
jgi:hypothetical protein